MKKSENIILYFLPIIILIIVFIFINNFSNWDALKALLYPAKDISFTEIGDSHGNRLEIVSFTDGKQVPSLSFIQISEPGLNSIPENRINGQTPYAITIASHDIKDVVIEAEVFPGHNLTFVAWAGCDVELVSKCQVSVTNFQKRRIEAHFSSSEPKLDLQLFNISNNPITGTLSPSWSSVNPAIAYKAAYTHITGLIPNTISSLSSLQLNLGGSRFLGSIPSEIGQMENIQYLGLYKNHLSGQIPKEIGNLRNLRYLLLYGNNLSGQIPKEIGNLRNLARLELHDNRLSGAVPKELANIKNLNPSELRLYNNQISSIESGLLSNSNWEGVNFNSNSFSTDTAKAALSDAAQRNGSYIDFCGNNVVGGTITYNKEGIIEKVEIEPEVNAAANAGWNVFIPINLIQEYEVYGGHRGHEPCRLDGSCDYIEEETESVCLDQFPSGACDDPVEVTTRDAYCRDNTSCTTPTYTGFDTPPPPGNVECARITGPINGPGDIEPNSVGIPVYLRHVYHYNSCRWWIGPGHDCKPICQKSGACSLSGSNCSNNNYCDHVSFQHSNVFGSPADDDSRGSCPLISR